MKRLVSPKSSGSGSSSSRGGGDLGRDEGTRCVFPTAMMMLQRHCVLLLNLLNLVVLGLMLLLLLLLLFEKKRPRWRCRP